MQGLVMAAGCILALAVLATPALAEESDGFVLLEGEEYEKNLAVRTACQGGAQRWFNVGAMFIGFREALEACVIIAVVVNMLNKTGMPGLKPYAWYGVAGGLTIALLCGVGIVAAFYAVQASVPTYKDKAAFSGVFSLVAGVFLAGIGIQFLRFRDIEIKYKKKLSKEVETLKSQGSDAGQTAQNTPKVRFAMLWDKDMRGTSFSILALTFSAVLREGLEMMLFLAAVAGEFPPESIALGAITGLILGCMFGYVIFLAGKYMKSIGVFLTSMTVFVLFIAGGLIALAAAAFKTVALVDMGLTDPDTVMSRPVYDIYKSTGEGHQTCGFWAVLRAVVGYTHNPSLIWWIVYALYWVIVLSIIGYRIYKGTLYSKWGADGDPEDPDRAQAARDVESGLASSSSSDSALKGQWRSAAPGENSVPLQPSGPPRMPVPPSLPGGMGYPVICTVKN